MHAVGNGDRVAIGMAHLGCRKHGLKRLLMELAGWDEVASLLLLRLVVCELVLHLGKVSWVRERLFASAWIEMIVDRRRSALVRVKGAWADARCVGCTLVLKLKAAKLSVCVGNLPGRIVFWRVRSGVGLSEFVGPGQKLRVRIAVA